MNSIRFSAATLIMYLIIPIVGNGAYFIGCNGNYPSCGMISMIFFNISFLCLFLPLLTNSRGDEVQQRGGQRLLASMYLVIESVIALLYIFNNAKATSAGVVQLLLFGVFILIYFGINRANLQSTQSIQNNRASRSDALLEANSMLRLKMNDLADSCQRDVIRLAVSELTSMPVTSSQATMRIDERILASTEELCDNPTKENYLRFSNLVAKRRTMSMLSMQ